MLSLRYLAPPAIDAEYRDHENGICCTRLGEQRLCIADHCGELGVHVGADSHVVQILLSATDDLSNVAFIEIKANIMAINVLKRQFNAISAESS